MNDRERQERVGHELEMLARINPEGADLILEELRFWKGHVDRLLKANERTLRRLATAQRKAKEVKEVLARA